MGLLRLASGRQPTIHVGKKGSVGDPGMCCQRALLAAAGALLSSDLEVSFAFVLDPGGSHKWSQTKILRPSQGLRVAAMSRNLYPDSGSMAYQPHMSCVDSVSFADM